MTTQGLYQRYFLFNFKIDFTSSRLSTQTIKPNCNSGYWLTWFFVLKVSPDCKLVLGMEALLKLNQRYL